MKKNSFYKALSKGFFKLVLMLTILAIICLSIGMAYNFFEFYPPFLSSLPEGGFSKESYAGAFSMGLVSLPFILILLALTVILFGIILFLTLDLGGYYE